jgi:hypothetical protein
VIGSTNAAVLPKRATLHDLQEEAAYDRNPIGAGIVRLVRLMTCPTGISISPGA